MLRNLSGQSLADLTMAEGPARTPPPRSFTSDALSEDESSKVTQLLSYLAENSYAYDSHVQLISILHKGLLAHVYANADTPQDATGDPRTYALLKDLRQAREAMDTRFSVGEDLWAEWLSDEVLLARSAEERITVTELFTKAVQDEPSSVKLWQAYGDWMHANYSACSGADEAASAGMTEEDLELCRELFTLHATIDVYEQAVSATQYCIDASHLVWDRYAELVQQSVPDVPSLSDMERIRDLYVTRLRIPHVTSRETQQAFWPIVNKIEPQNWENVMAQVSETAEPAQKQVALREEHELSVQRAIASNDNNAVYAAFSAYMQWERKHRSRGAFGPQLCYAVHERALLRLPTCTEWWLDYIDLMTETVHGSRVLPVIERATRHCPWSGDLWARRILLSDVQGKSREEIEATKHRATNSGLLDVGGMEELLKVLQQWCSYLRRFAFRTGSTDDDQDAAEVAIASSIEDIQHAGQTVYGKAFAGDPLYRLETIQIKFLTEARRLNDAREIFKRLLPVQKKSYDFWCRFYDWELRLWGYQRMSDATRVETAENGPHLATSVLQQALAQRDLDYPEKVLEMYVNHFQQHESSDKLQAAMIAAREFSKRLAAQRAQEAEAALAQQPATEVPAAAATAEKRKAEESLTNSHGSKKHKSEAVLAFEENTGENSAFASAQAKRDREHNTVTVRNLPINVHDVDIKKFFRDVGQPLSINILQDEAGGTSSATVEFESHEDVLAAKTRNGRKLNGHEVRVQSGSQNTLYVSNYPPEFDETAIRQLFHDYGEIVSVRFPSLKYNNRRRFCYVQYLTDEMARDAEANMDSKMLDGQHKLIAKISNPDAKKQRSGAQAEGRELFVKNTDREAPESEVKAFFGQYGEVVSMNLVKLTNNKRSGSGFIVYSSADEANAALAANNKPFRDRILHVEISTPKAEGRAAPMERARKTDIIIKPVGASASPEPDARRGSNVSMKSAPLAHDDSYRTAKERKIAIFSLPDTVNDARIRTAMEKYGPIVKIQLRRQDNGAIVEFQNVKDAFNVRQGVDVTALGPEVKTGDVADLLNKVKKRQADAAAAPSTESSTAFRPASVSRPGQKGASRRGGLGFKRGGGAAGGQASAERGAAATANGGGGRSNADFRAMLEQSKAKPASEEA